MNNMKTYVDRKLDIAYLLGKEARTTEIIKTLEELKCDPKIIKEVRKSYEIKIIQ